VGNLIEKPCQIDRHAPFIALFNNHLNMVNGLALAVTSAKPIVGSAKIRLEYFLKYQIGTLTDHPIHYHGYGIQTTFLFNAAFGTLTVLLLFAESCSQVSLNFSQNR
jgi:hypothetical protein